MRNQLENITLINEKLQNEKQALKNSIYLENPQILQQQQPPQQIGPQKFKKIINNLIRSSNSQEFANGESIREQNSKNDISGENEGHLLA